MKTSSDMENKQTKSHAERYVNVWKILIIFHLSSLPRICEAVFLSFSSASDHNSILPCFYEHKIEKRKLLLPNHGEEEKQKH